MRHKIAIVLLSLGAVGGFAAGCASLHRYAGHPSDHRQRFETHVADVCVQAALRATQDKTP